MNADSMNKWLTLAANLGVVAGLVFLRIEINQNTRATIAAASEEVTNQSLDYFALGMDQPSHCESTSQTGVRYRARRFRT